MSETPGTVARALAVLTVLAESKDAVGVKDVARALNLPMSTSHRLLDLLLESGFVEKDEARRRYSTGLEFLRLANLVVQKRPYSDLVQPSLDRIAAQTGETAIYAIYSPALNTAIYAAKSDSPNSLRFRITLFQQVPVEWGASGLAILAFLPPDIQEQICASPRPSPLTGKALSRTALTRRIATVRDNGFAFSESERLLDSFGIAVPVTKADGEAVGSIALTIPKVRFETAQLESYVALLKGEALRLFTGRDPMQKMPAPKGS
jgi:DNA-binding IclR family transcriptional regulator